MKKIGLLHAMKLCWDYKRMNIEKKDRIRRKRLKKIVSYAKQNSPYYKHILNAEGLRA